MIGKFATFAAAAAIVMTASADGPFRSFTVEPASFSAKAGELLVANVTFECEDGYEMRSWALRVIRKHAPAEFFAVPGLSIKVHGKSAPHDVVEVCPSLKFTKPLTKGSFPVRLNTAGMKVGDYAFGLQGVFFKDGKYFYKGATVPVTITENDDKTFAPTPQTLPTPESCSLFELTPYCANLAAGEKLVVQGKVRPVPGMKVTGWGVSVIRKSAPKEFFDRPDAPVVKHPKLKEYDAIQLRKYAAEAPTDELNFTFEQDTTNFAPGEYNLSFSIYLTGGDKKASRYPYMHFPLVIR